MINKVLILLGAFVLPTLAIAQPPSVTLSTPPPSNGTICVGGFVYTFSSVNTATGQYNYLYGGSTCGGTYSSGAYQHAYHTVADGPNSLQFQSARTALDLESFDVEGDARFSDQSDSDTIGGAVTYFGAPGTDGERLEGRYENNWRPFEGQRTRAIVNLPVNAIVENSGQAAISGLASGGLEFQAGPGWSVTPRAGVGAASGDKFFGGDGVLGTVSLGSRYRFAQVGRGDLVIGNLISYTTDTLTKGNDYVFRNGAAYQFPLKQLFFGRQMSARFSYVNTYVGGDEIGIHNYHELAMNFGVRMREQDPRNRFEMLRFGVLYTHADKYDSGTFTLGYRF